MQTDLACGRFGGVRIPNGGVASLSRIGPVPDGEPKAARDHVDPSAIHRGGGARSLSFRGGSLETAMAVLDPAPQTVTSVSAWDRLPGRSARAD